MLDPEFEPQVFGTSTSQFLVAVNRKLCFSTEINWRVRGF